MKIHIFLPTSNPPETRLAAKAKGLRLTCREDRQSLLASEWSLFAAFPRSFTNQPVKHRAHHAFHKALKGISGVRCRQMVCIGHVISESWTSKRVLCAQCLTTSANPTIIWRPLLEIR